MSLSQAGSRATRLLVLLVVGILGVAGVVHLATGPSTRTLSAVFERTVGVFVGSDVKVMGIVVGEVTALHPEGTDVRVDMTYDAAYQLPADAKAVVIAPSVIADRFVQITPGYVDGPVLADGAVIGLDDTRVPVELDRSLGVTTDLMTALGPDGANRDGALSGALASLADALDGRGDDARQTLAHLTDVSQVLADGAPATASTVRHLAGLAQELSDHDADVRSFNTHLAGVSRLLARDSGQLSRLLEVLAGTLGRVEGFVRDNRTVLTRDVSQLSSVAQALVSERDAIDEVLDIVPLAFTNLVETYDPQAQAVRTRANFTEIVRAVDKVVCQELVKSAPALQPVCDQLQALVQQLPTLPTIPGLPPLPGGGGTATSPSVGGTLGLVGSLLSAAGGVS